MEPTQDKTPLGTGNQILMIDPKQQPFYVNESDFDKAQAKGYKPASIYVDPTTRKQEIIPKGLEADAESKGLVNFYTQQGKDQAAEVKDTFNPLESAAYGAAKNTTFGLAPVASGAFQAAKKALSGDTNLGENYRMGRDAFKDSTDEAYNQNPTAYLAGAIAPTVAGIGGSLLSGAGKAAALSAPTLAQSIGKGALQGGAIGGLQGAATSNADLTKGDITGTLKDAALGALIGAPVGGAAEGIINLGSSGLHALKHAASEALEDTHSHDIYSKALNFGKNLFQSGKATQEAEKDLADLATQRAAEGLKGSDDSALLRDIFTPGSNPTKNFIVDKAETSLPGNLSAAAEGESVLQRAFNLSPEERMAARTFDKDKAAKSVVDNLRNAVKEIKVNKGNIFSQGQEEAAGAYDTNNIRDILFAVDDAVADANSGSLGGAAKSALKKAKDTLFQGKALSTYKIEKGPLDLDNVVDSFRRLQASREALDPAILAARKAGDSQEMYVLGNLRKAIDDELKSSAPKAMADKAYAEITQPLNAIMKPIVNRDTGKIDPFKLGNTFNDSTMGKTFRANLDELEAAVNTYKDQMNPESLKTITDTMGSLKDFANTSQNQKLLQGIRQASGPTSPAVERQAEVYARAGLNKGLIEKPASTLVQADNFLVKKAQEQFGKNYSDLSPEEQGKLISMLKGVIDNPEADAEATKTLFKSIKSKAPKTEDIVKAAEPTVSGTLGGTDNSPSAQTRLSVERAGSSLVTELDDQAKLQFGKPYKELSLMEKSQIGKAGKYIANNAEAKDEITKNLMSYTPDSLPEDHSPYLEDKAQSIFKTAYDNLNAAQKKILEVLNKYRGNDKGFIGDGGRVPKTPGVDTRSKEEILKDLNNTFKNTSNSQIAEEMSPGYYPKSNRTMVTGEPSIPPPTPEQMKKYLQDIVSRTKNSQIAEDMYRPEPKISDQSVLKELYKRYKGSKFGDEGGFIGEGGALPNSYANSIDELIGTKASVDQPSVLNKIRNPNILNELDTQAQIQFGKNYKDLTLKEMEQIGKAGKYIANNKEAKDEITKNLMSDVYTPEVTLDHSPYPTPQKTTMQALQELLGRGRK